MGMLIVFSVCCNGEECSDCNGNRSDVVDLLQTSTMARSSDARSVDKKEAVDVMDPWEQARARARAGVKEHALPQSGSCPDGYIYLPGRVVRNYGGLWCEDDTFEPGWCILTAAEARYFCDSHADCWGISETSNEGWRRGYPGMVQIGSYGSDLNSEWATCKGCVIVSRIVSRSHFRWRNVSLVHPDTYSVHRHIAQRMRFVLLWRLLRS